MKQLLMATSLMAALTLSAPAEQTDLTLLR